MSVSLDLNGITIKWTGSTVPSNRFAQASPRNLPGNEWFVIVDDLTKSNITDYAQGGLGGMFYDAATFDKDIYVVGTLEY